ncbi:MAG: TetR/AcrR family transcriptional regulator [Candidatus Hodarchaeales archaeon]|jgi:AcrR family transcriptional regulator
MASRNNTAEKIIQAAVELIARRGYHNTSIKDITDKLGLTKPAIYAHFRSKAEIARRIIELYELEHVDREIQIVENLEGTAVDKLHRVLSFGSEFRATNLDLYIAFLSLRHHCKNDPEFEVILTRVRVKHETFLENLLRLGIKQGVFKNSIDPQMIALFIGAVARGMSEEWMDRRNQLDGEQLNRAFRTVLFKGIEATPSDHG